jgi:DNA polymerase-3 subunit gamma/tau
VLDPRTHERARYPLGRSGRGSEQVLPVTWPWVDSAKVPIDQQNEPAEQQPQSLYRRHRPRTFADVVGQEPVVRTLRNAVQRGKVHHAYLFVGSRGTGKTSMAKILAACLNCDRDPAHPTIEPCGECESCISIAHANSLDVIEMDAASNNSVDDIRELRESVAYSPVSGRSKVYILDEAHMLSTAAWNAFLKTLEEPPPNTVFVLATTEAGKVPATVVDRCHRFDFHRPTVEQLASVVRRAAQAESIEIPPEAVAAVARSATGSFRDALGTLEQLLTYSGSEIALEDVLAVLGVADAGLLEELVDAVDAGDARRALIALERCVEGGRDAGSFAGDLEVHARELLVVQTLGELPAELSLTEEADARLRAQAERVDRAVVVRLLELLGAALEGVRAGADPRTRLELALVKAARPEVDTSTPALLARIERLERERGGVNALAGDRVVPTGERGGPVGEAMPEPGDRTSSGRADAEPPSATPGPDQGGVGSDTFSTQAAAPMNTGPGTTRAVEQAPIAEVAGGTDPGVDAEGASGPVPAPPAGRHEPAPTPPADLAPEAMPAPEAMSAPKARAAPDTAPAGDLDSMRAVWPAVVDVVRAGNGLLGALIADARPAAVDGEDLTVAFASTAAFLKKKAEHPDNRAIVTEALRQVTGGRWRLSYELLEVDEEAASEQATPTEEEWVRRFMEEFDAEELFGDQTPGAETVQGGHTSENSEPKEA